MSCDPILLDPAVRPTIPLKRAGRPGDYCLIGGEGDPTAIDIVITRKR